MGLGWALETVAMSLWLQCRCETTNFLHAIAGDDFCASKKRVSLLASVEPNRYGLPVRA